MGTRIILQNLKPLYFNASYVRYMLQQGSILWPVHAGITINSCTGRQLTNSMEPCPSEINSRLATQKFCSVTVTQRFCTVPRAYHWTLSWAKWIQWMPTHSFSKIQFNITLPFIPRSFRLLYLIRSSRQNFLYMVLLACVFCVPSFSSCLIQVFW